MDNPTARQYFSLLLLAATSLAAAVLLTSCESIGGGGYGPGAGFFDTVVVDAGHGGIDRGAKASSGACEKALTLDTAHRLAEILRAEGFGLSRRGQPTTLFLSACERPFRMAARRLN